MSSASAQRWERREFFLYVTDMRRDAAKAKVTLKRWDEWHLCWHEDVELHHGNPAQFDLIKLRSEFSRLCWRLVTIRSRLLQRWNDKLDNTCQVSFVVLGERYCDLYKWRSKIDFVYLFSRTDKIMFFVILFLLRKTFEFDPDGVDIRSNCLKTILYGYWTGFRIKTVEFFIFTTQSWKEVPYCSNWTYS